MPSPLATLCPLSKLLRVLVTLLVAASVLLTVAQRLDGASPWWLELSRYLPYPVFLAPSVVAFGLSLPLGRRWLAASAATVALVAIVLMDLQWHLRPQPAAGGTAHLRLMTYNIKAYKAIEHTGGFNALAREVSSHDPDILLMQDAQAALHGSPFAPSGPIFGLPHVFIAGQYIVATRLPLHGCSLRHTEPPYLNYVSCVVEAGGHALNLVTAHFESPRQGLVATRRDGLEGAEDWRQNYLERLLQSRALAADLQDVPGPLIVAGDMNAPNGSPVVRGLLDVGMRDAFAAIGRGYGYTYGHALKVGFSFLRIDHVLVSPTIGLVDCVVGDAAASDHRPVIVDLRLPP